MSRCPTCPRCGDFAGIIVSEVKVTTTTDWREEDTKLAYKGSKVRCLNGHTISSREVVWK